MNTRSLYKKPQLVLLTLIFTIMSAQPLLAQDGFEDDVDDQEPAVPIDGSYIVIGLIAGALYGVRFLNKQVKV